MLSITDAQKDMSDAYLNGVPGIVTSGTIWLIAGIVALLISPTAAISTLVFGGMAIFPISVLLCKLAGRSGKHQSDNPLAALANEGTVWMLLSIPIAIGAAFYRYEWFFPAMLLVIAGRYLTFQTLYGNKLFWLFAAALATAGIVSLMNNAPVFVGALLGGGIEWLFAAIIFKFSNLR